MSRDKMREQPLQTQRVYAIGIDPGATGAVVVLEPRTKGVVRVFDWSGEPETVAAELRGLGDSFAVIERQQYMAKGGHVQGAKSAFSLGENYGIWKGILAGLRIEYQTVPPRAWQRYVFGSGTVCGDTKERSLMRAKQLLPDLELVPDGARTPHHGRSDAGLIAFYAAAVIRKRGEA